MTKFQKRIVKQGKKFENCLLIGEGFGHLQECLEVFKTVFVLSDQRPDVRAKNLIFRDNKESFSEISEITHIIFDLKNIETLEKYQYLWVKHNSIIIIEGNEPIGREFSKSLYNTSWQCTDTQGYFHVWEKIK